MINKIDESLAFLKKEGVEKINIGIVLGTGMYDLIEHLEIKKSIPYSKIPNFPEATQEFQKGILHYGHLEGKKVLVFQGRFISMKGILFLKSPTSLEYSKP